MLVLPSRVSSRAAPILLYLTTPYIALVTRSAISRIRTRDCRRTYLSVHDTDDGRACLLCVLMSTQSALANFLIS